MGLSDIVDFGINAGEQMAGAKGDTTNVRAYLTNPTNGIQTIAGKAFAQIIATYEQIGGKTSQGAIQATIAAIEGVRSSFEAKVNSLGNMFWIAGGRGAVETINRVAAQLISDRRAELAAIGGSIEAGAGATAVIGGLPLWQWAVVLVLVFLIFRR